MRTEKEFAKFGREELLMLREKVEAFIESNKDDTDKFKTLLDRIDEKLKSLTTEEGYNPSSNL